ncbi:MAG: hypothetical protein F6K17_38650, partial [Okeania sp. SIO3C4]|nr:hypothetical protein [Okeania sp. SIO3C4]
IREILNQGSFNVKNQTSLSINQSSSSEKSSLTTADASATGKMFWGATGGTVGSVAAGIGGATLANIAGAHIVLGSIGAGLALTPVGWALLGSSGIVGGVVAWWQRRTEVQKFQEKMQAEVKEAFKELLKEEKVSALKEQVRQLFNSYEKSAKLMREDVESLEKSLGNLLEKKRKTSVNTEAEKKRLQTFVDNISAQWETIETKYKEIASVQSKSS